MTKTLTFSVRGLIRTKMGTGYPGKFCTVARVTFLTAFSLTGFFANPGLLSAQSKNIDFPEPPKVVPPVEIDKKMLDEDLRKKKSNHEEHKPEITPETKAPEIKQEELIAKESLSPHPMRYVFEASLLYTFASASGTRKQYKSDPTSHFNFLYRFTEGSVSSVSGYAGFRLAPFVGTGRQKNYKGRFSLTYFGPSIGIGNLSNGSRGIEESPVRGAETAAEASDARLGAPSKFGWLLTSGLAAVSKSGSKGKDLVNESEVGDDFKAQAIGFDSPGFWIEARILYLKHNAFSVGPILGAQTGEQKFFGYFGAAFSGWY